MENIAGWHGKAPSYDEMVKALDELGLKNVIAYDALLKKAKEYIKAGDIFQVVLSQRFQAPFELPPFALYRALRGLNRVQVSPPDGAFYAFIKVDGVTDSVAFAKEILAKTKVGLAPGAAFGLGEETDVGLGVAQRTGREGGIVAGRVMGRGCGCGANE